MDYSNEKQFPAAVAVTVFVGSLAISTQLSTSRHTEDIPYARSLAPYSIILNPGSVVSGNSSQFVPGKAVLMRYI